MAQIRKHRDKWQVRIRRDGVVLTKTFTRKQDAERWARHIEVKAERRDLPPDIKQLAKITLAELVTRYRDEVTPCKKGAEMETVVLDAFLRHPICKKKLCDLTTTDLANIETSGYRTSSRTPSEGSSTRSRSCSTSRKRSGTSRLPSILYRHWRSRPVTISENGG